MDADVPGVFLFLAILPLLNAILDTVSYSVTLVLAQLGLRLGWGALILGILDFIVAGVMFLLLGIVLVVTVAAMNVVSGIDFVDLGTVLSQVQNFSEYWWLYAMLFSTVLPTALHAVVAAFSLQAIVPLSWRTRLLQQIEARDEDAVSASLAALKLGLIWFWALPMPFILIGGACYYARGWLAPLGERYLSILYWAASQIGAI